MPDSLAVSAIRRKPNLAVVGYIKGDRNGWRQASVGDLAKDIGQNWADRQR
jgi:hypothetical protein